MIRESGPKPLTCVASTKPADPGENYMQDVSSHGAMRGLRVLVLTNMYPSPTRPIHGTFVAEQVDSLRQRGLHIDVLFVDGPASRWNYLRGVGQLRRILRTPYDLIHAHYVFCGVIALMQRRLPVVVTHHGIEAQIGWTAPLCRAVSRAAQATIATSTRVARGLALSEVTLLPCGVNVTLFAPMPQVEARAALGLPVATPLVLFVGTPRPEKRLSLIEMAVDQLRQRVPDVRLLAVHNAPREQIPLYMNACDVLVLASVAEGAPMVVREALACNLPLVSTDVGDVRELCADLPGHFIAAADATDLAAKLQQAITFGSRTHGRDAILPWSLERVAERVQQVYQNALPQQRHSTGAYT